MRQHFETLRRERALLRSVADAARREHAARAAWLARVTCTNPPPQALLDAEAATEQALAALAALSSADDEATDPEVAPPDADWSLEPHEVAP